MKKKVFMIVFLMLVFAFAIHASADVPTITLPVEQDEDYAMAKDFVNYLNQQRKATGKIEYIMDAGLTDFAMLRAAEICIGFSHSRPGGVSKLEMMTFHHEDIGAGASSSEDIYGLWYNSPGHKPALTNTEDRYVGVGCAMYNRTRYWVLITDQNPLQAGSIPDGIVRRTRNVKVEVCPEIFRGFYRIWDFMYYGDFNNTEGIHVRNTENSDSPTLDAGSYVIPGRFLTIMVNNPDIFTVDPATGYVKPKKPGTGTMTVALKGFPQIPASTISVTIKQGDKDGAHIGVSGGNGEGRMSCYVEGRELKEPGYLDWSMMNAHPNDPDYFFLRYETGLAYNDVNVRPKVKIVDGFGNTLTENIDYTLTYTQCPYYPSLWRFIVIRGINNYSFGYNAMYIVNDVSANTGTGGSTSAPTTAGGGSTSTPPSSTPQVVQKASSGGYTVKLSKTSYTYNGKAQKPKVTVTYNGKKLSAKNYTVTYKNNKNAGIATVTVKGKGSYKKLNMKLNFKINLKKMQLKSVKSQKTKQATVKWKKDSQVGGYQIQLATNAKFTAGVKTTKLSKGKTSYTFKGLVKKKKYYVRIRAYKKVAGQMWYGPWSSKKSVKVK